MPVYFSIDEAINRLVTSMEWSSSIKVGLDEVCNFIADLLMGDLEKKKGKGFLALDGFLGIEWEKNIPHVKKALEEKGLEVKSVDFSLYYKPNSEIEKMVEPLLTRERTFGYVYKGRLEDFLDSDKTLRLKKELKDFKKSTGESQAVICFGCGAAIPSLRKLYDQIFYFDLTREELFNRSERNPIYFLGSNRKGKPVHQYLKRFYYVDSQVLNKQKKYVLEHANWYAESCISQQVKLVPIKIYREILSSLAEKPFAVKPLYYPVTWGGNWLKKLKKLPESMLNSGQGCIVASENSIRIGVDNIILEVPFLNLLWNEPIKVLGKYPSRRFRKEYPFTYWYDDAIKGWNMAIQVHAPGAYLKKQFNEQLRQDESYYVLHTGPRAKTYLGLKEDADINDFRQATEKSEKRGALLDYERYINSIMTKPGDYFLIPAGTIHASGRNQVVLEIDGGIAAYSPGYTFHIYDYLKPDLDGALRAIHIEHAFNVIRPNRRRKWVLENLCQKPKLVKSGDGWKDYLIGKRKDIFFETHRLEISTRAEDNTKGRFHILSLVEGESVLVQSKEHPERSYELNFPDTITVPACVGRYSIINLGSKECKVVKALVGYKRGYK